MSFDTVDMARLRGLGGYKWRRYGDDVLPAWVADMDFLQAKPIRDYVARAAATGDLGYPYKEGPEPLQEVFAERAMRRYGWRVEPARIELLIDVVDEGRQVSHGLLLSFEVHDPGGRLERLITIQHGC